MTISSTPSAPPRLMICSIAGISASPPSRPKRLVPVYFDLQELLEALGLDQLVEDRPPALPGEADLLAEALDPLLEPGRLRRVGDVHVLQREGAAVGALHQRQDLAQGRRARGRARCR